MASETSAQTARYEVWRRTRRGSTRESVHRHRWVARWLARGKNHYMREVPEAQSDGITRGRWDEMSKVEQFDYVVRLEIENHELRRRSR